MPSTQYNVDRILDWNSKYSEAQVLQAFDEAQKMVYSEESEQTMKIDSATGMPPYLATTVDVYQYDCPADCRRTAAIFTESWPYPYSRTRPNTPWKEYYYRFRSYWNTPVHSRDALPENDQRATVTFYINPGTTTDKYYHAYWVLVDDLTAVTQQLVIPDHVHWRLRRIVQSLLTNEQYGKSGFDERDIEKQIKKIRSELNQGAQTIMQQTPWQSEFQEFPEDWHAYRH